MVLYDLSLYVMAEQIRTELTGFLQSWYADYFITAGAGANILSTIERI